MSFSRLTGRFLLPAIGLGLALALVVQTARSGRVELPAWPGRAEASAAAGKAAPPRAQPGEPRSIRAEGHVVPRPGALVVVGAETSGTILRVLVGERSAVRRGDLLVEFRSDEARAQRDEAAARVAEAEAEVARVDKEQRRLEALLPRNPAYREDIDRGHLQLVGYRARRDAAKAALAGIEAALRRHLIVAPIDGVVTARHAQPGETVGAAAALITVVDLARLRVEAEVDEYDVSRCAPGGPARITTESFPGRSWEGVVEEISDTLVGRKLRPEDPGRPTDTRVLPVRVAVRGLPPLRLGQRVEVEIAAAPAEPRRPPSTTEPPRPTLPPEPRLGTRRDGTGRD